MLLRKFWSGCLKQCKSKSALFNLLTSSLRTTKFRFHYPEHQFHRLQILTIFIYLVCRQIHVREISRQSVLCSISGNLFVVDGYFDFILHVKELVAKILFNISCSRFMRMFYVFEKNTWKFFAFFRLVSDSFSY